MCRAKAQARRGSRKLPGKPPCTDSEHCQESQNNPEMQKSCPGAGQDRHARGSSPCTGRKWQKITPQEKPRAFSSFCLRGNGKCLSPGLERAALWRAPGFCCGCCAAVLRPGFMGMWQRDMGKKLNQPIHPIFLEDNYKKKKKKRRETLRFLTQKLLCREQHGERLLLLHRGPGDAHSFLSSAPSCLKSLHPEAGRTTTGSGSSSFAAGGEITGISKVCLKWQGSLGGVGLPRC